MRYKILDQNGMNYLTLTIVEWIDLFTRPVYSDIIIESLQFCQQHKDLKVHAYVIMPSHLHLVLSTTAETGLLPILQSFKIFYCETNRQIFTRQTTSRKPSRMVIEPFCIQCTQAQNT